MKQATFGGEQSASAGFTDTSKTLPADFRRAMFTCQDGMMLCLLVSACCRAGLLDSSGGITPKTAGLGDEYSDRLPDPIPALPLQELARRYSANPGYLEVALRCFSQQGWLIRERTADGSDWIHRCSDSLRRLKRGRLDTYRRLGDFLSKTMPFERSLMGDAANPEMRRQFAGFIEEARRSWDGEEIGILQEHQTGALLVPLMVAFLQAGLLETDSLRLETASPEGADLLAAAGWLDKERHCWTPDGELARDHALYLGMVGSYIPTLVRLHSILFENAEQSTHTAVGQTEAHVDRTLNILASAAAHHKYFISTDEIFAGIFDQEPVESQPQFIMDTGCGDGSWLAHLYEFIAHNTKRGKALERYPLTLIGVDYNVVCEDVCLNVFREAGVPGMFLTGDITDPAGIADKLAQRGMDMSRGLHIRSFIDHNRVFERPVREPASDALEPTSSYVGEDQKPIPGRVLRQNLVEFLEKWAAYANPHGLVILEAHCVEPAIAAKQLGQTHNLVFDTYHCFSHQYPVDFDVFMEAALEAGLRPVMHQQQRYPSRKPFVSISVNHFRAPSEATYRPVPEQSSLTADRSQQWRPAPDASPEDGDHLHSLLYTKGALDHPRPWCHAATGLLLRPILKQLAYLMDQIEAGTHPRREIHLIDYGAGTGMATIELLRACQDNGFLHQCDTLGVRFRISLLDIPSNWFARAYSLLHNCPYVEFHSIRDAESGRFLPLTQVLGGEQADIVMASMVFHLIPPAPLRLTFENLASVLTPSGLLAWNSPDIGPAGKDSILFHDANRELRRRFLEYLENPDQLLETRWAIIAPEEALAVKTELARLELTDEMRERLSAQANAQILPRANSLKDLITLAAPEFETSHTHTASFEIRVEEIVDTLLVPSNQRYLGEVADRALRESLICGLMLHDVIPDLRQGSARTLRGCSVHWTYGEFVKRP